MAQINFPLFQFLVVIFIYLDSFGNLISGAEGRSFVDQPLLVIQQSEPHFLRQYSLQVINDTTVERIQNTNQFEPRWKKEVQLGLSTMKSSTLAKFIKSEINEFDSQTSEINFNKARGYGHDQEIWINGKRKSISTSELQGILGLIKQVQVRSKFEIQKGVHFSLKSKKITLNTMKSKLNIECKQNQKICEIQHEASKNIWSMVELQ